VAEFELEIGGRKAHTEEWPKITLVTAVYNGEEYLEATMRSVVNQGYPNLEYIVVDDGSTDGTVDIIRKYEPALTCWFSQTNQGLFAALNAGFARSTGEVMGWLNSSDLLQVNGLFTVGDVFRVLHDVEWITGRPTKISATGLTIDVLPVPRWSQGRFLAGANKYIQQESTFWRRSLWERAGGRLSTAYRGRF
jgi:glycosyltransferase involved in cell wall biosynthesis